MGTESRHRRRTPFAALLGAAAALALSMGVAPPAVAADDDPEGVVVMTPERQAHIQQMMLDLKQANDLPGIALAVVTPDPAGSAPVVTTFYAGSANLETGAPVDADTRFELGSETKTFTADLLAHLVATGRVSLDEPIQTFAPSGVVVPSYIDATGEPARPITLRDLATHKAGLPLYPPGYPFSAPETYTQEDLWNAFSEASPAVPMWRPGTTWFYSNWGFGLLGTIVSNLIVEGSPTTEAPPLQQALQETFLDALGMSATQLEDDGDPHLAVPYNRDSGTNVAVPYWNNTNALSGGGGLVSTAEDMARFVAAHLGYAATDPAPGVQSMADSLEPAATVTVCSSGPRAWSPGPCTPAQFEMGLGWELFPADAQSVGVPWVVKWGGTGGTNSQTALAPTLRTGVTSMFNQTYTNPQTNASEGDSLSSEVLRYLVEQRNAPPRPPAGHGGDDEPRRHELAESGLDAVGLLLPAAGGAALLTAGVLLASRRRKVGPRVGR